MRLRIVAAILGVGVVLAGCGNEAIPGQAAPAAEDAGSAGGDCPLTAEELSSATSLSFKQEETRKDHPLETLESVKVTACIYTAAEAKQAGGDPLVVRVDVVPAKDTGTVKQNFASTCTEFGGKERAAGGGTVCERNGSVVDGVIGNLVVVSIVNADKDVAVKLSPSFGKVLAAAG
jgi:hypothetical protein